MVLLNVLNSLHRRPHQVSDGPRLVGGDKDLGDHSCRTQQAIPSERGVKGRAVVRLAILDRRQFGDQLATPDGASNSVTLGVKAKAETP